MSATVSLYRVVSSAELADLRTDGAFRTVPGHMEAKQFWTAPGDAVRYLSRLEWIGLGPNDIVEVRIQAADLDRIAAVFVDSRPARSIDEAELTWFNGCIVKLILPETKAPDG